VGVLKFPKLGFSRLWVPITLSADLQLKWGLKQKCSPCRKLSNDISHVIFTQGNRGNSRFLVVGNQIVDLTSGLFFYHNLCYKCPNESCEPTLDIYVPRPFQWYKELFNPLGFNPYDCSLKLQKSIETLIPKMQTPLGV
jgi:hypothetical protein